MTKYEHLEGVKNKQTNKQINKQKTNKQTNMAASNETVFVCLPFEAGVFAT